MIEALGLTVIGFLAIFVDLLFLPGAIIAAGGVVLILYGVYLTHLDAGLWAALIHLAACLVVAPKLILWSLDRVALKKELSKEEGYVATEDLSSHVGQQGRAVSDLKPSGKVMLDNGEMLDCISEDGYIDKDSLVIIASAQGGHVVVQKASKES